MGGLSLGLDIFQAGGVRFQGSLLIFERFYDVVVRVLLCFRTKLFRFEKSFFVFRRGGFKVWVAAIGGDASKLPHVGIQVASLVHVVVELILKGDNLVHRPLCLVPDVGGGSYAVFDLIFVLLKLEGVFLDLLQGLVDGLYCGNGGLL